MHAGAYASETFAPTPLTAGQILARASSARGSVGTGTYRRVYELTRGNGTVAQSEVIERGDDYRRTLHDSNYESSYGSYRGTSWSQDSNGTVTIESGFHETANPYAVSLRSVEKDDSGTTVLGITTAEPAMVVVEVAPRAGLSQRRYYDAKTFLVQRIESETFGKNRTTTAYGNYVTKFGFKLPQSTTYEDGHADNATHSRLVSFERLSGDSTSLAPPLSRRLFNLGGRASLQIPAEFNSGGIVVRVTVAGRGLDFQLDSGAAPMVIDEGVARSLGLSLYGAHTEAFGGDFKVANTTLPDMSLGDIHAHNVALEAIPFTRMVGERKVVGLLGGDFFASARIRVNFKDEALWMDAPSKVAPPAPWSAIPIEIDDLVPRVHAKFNAFDGAFIVDLGSDATLLYGHYFSHFVPKNKGDIVGEVQGVAGRTVGFKNYTFTRFDFGDLAFADASAIVPEGHDWEDEDYEGLLGRNILSNFNLLFDYANQRLYVQTFSP